jgi:hypothetical protein
MSCKWTIFVFKLKTEVNYFISTKIKQTSLMYVDNVRAYTKGVPEPNLKKWQLNNDTHPRQQNHSFQTTLNRLTFKFSFKGFSPIIFI